jgi:hypothetical protein
MLCKICLNINFFEKIGNYFFSLIFLSKQLFFYFKRTTFPILWLLSKIEHWMKTFCWLFWLAWLFHIFFLRRQSVVIVPFPQKKNRTHLLNEVEARKKILIKSTFWAGRERGESTTETNRLIRNWRVKKKKLFKKKLWLRDEKKNRQTQPITMDFQLELAKQHSKQ